MKPGYAVALPFHFVRPGDTHYGIMVPFRALRRPSVPGARYRIKRTVRASDVQLMPMNAERLEAWLEEFYGRATWSAEHPDGFERFAHISGLEDVWRELVLEFYLCDTVWGE